MNMSLFKFFIVIPFITLIHAIEKIKIDTNFNVPTTISGLLKTHISGKYQFQDKLGIHILILSLDNKVKDDNLQSISLKANQFINENNNWKSEWVIKDYIECENLDIFGEFQRALTTITDIDSNGVYETTVLYQMLCAGGLEPKITKAIMRQGAVKYAVRGESLIKIDKKTIYGGTFTPDKELDNVPKFKNHLIAIWKKGAGF